MSDFRRLLAEKAAEQRKNLPAAPRHEPGSSGDFRSLLRTKAAEQESRLEDLRAVASKMNATTKHLDDAAGRAAEKRPQPTRPQWIDELSGSDAAKLQNELSRYRPQRKAGETDAEMMERLGRAAEREWKTTDAALAAMGTSRVELRQQQKAPWVDNLSERDAARLQSELAAAANPSAVEHDVANLARKYDAVSAELSNISTSLTDEERTRQAQALGDRAAAYEKQIKDRQNRGSLAQRYLREFERNAYEKNIMSAPDFAEMSAKGADESNLEDKRHMINTVHLASYGDGSDPVYGEMTETEKSIFNYLWAARGEDEAEKYLKKLDETLSERAGRRLADRVLAEENDFLRGVGTTTIGVMSGFENAASGLKQTFTKETVTPTAGQYAAGYVRSELDGGSAFLFDLAQSAANMTPSILLSSATAGIGGAVGMSAGAAGMLGQVMGAVEMGLQSRGNAISEKLREGYTYEQASLYGTLVGASEGGLQYLLGGISKLGGKLTGGKVAAKIAAIDNTLGRISLKLGTNMASEGLEEGLQEILEPIFAALILNEDYEPAEWNEVAYAALLGAVSAGLFEGMSTFKTDGAQTADGRAITELGSDTVQAVIDAGLASERGSMAYKVAVELEARQAAGKTITPHALGEIYAEIIGTPSAELDAVFEAAEKKRVEAAVGEDVNMPRADSTIEKGVEDGAVGRTFAEEVQRQLRNTFGGNVNGRGGFEASEYDAGTSAQLRKSLDVLGKVTSRTYRFIDEIPMSGATANGLYDGDTVWLSRASKNPLAAGAAHETGHILAQTAPDAWAEFTDYAVNRVGEEKVRETYELYSRNGVISAVAEAREEVACDYLGELLGNEDTLRNFTKDIERGTVKRNTAQKILDAIRRFIAKVRGRTTEQRVARDLGITISEATRAMNMITRALNEDTMSTQGNTVAAPEQTGQRVAAAATAYSIEHDANGAPYVVIGDDILAGVPRKEWVRTVKENMREKFPNGVTVGNNVIEINHQSRHEMTYSRYMQQLMKNEPTMFVDKLRATNNADEIIRASRNYVNEALMHPRQDNIEQFARGEVQMRVGEHDYTAQVIVAMRSNGKLLLYDIINLAPIEISAQNKKSNAAISKNPSPGTERSTASGFSTPIISNRVGDVNAKFSLSGESLTDAAGEGIISDEERGAIVQYKSSESFKVNAVLRNGIAPTPEIQRIVDGLDSVLPKLPKYEGRVYRRLSFDMEGQAKMDEFISEYHPGAVVTLDAFTSASIEPDGFTLDGDLTVTLVIDGHSGRDVDGFGNNFEREVIFTRDTAIRIDRVQTDENGRPVIYATEVENNGREAETNAGRDRDDQRAGSVESGYGQAGAGREELNNELGNTGTVRESEPGEKGQRDSGGYTENSPGIRAGRFGEVDERFSISSDTDPELATMSAREEETEAAEIEAEIEAEDRQNLGRLVLPTVADTVINRLPKKAKDYLRRVERKFVRTFSEALGVPRRTQNKFLDGVVREISASYLDAGRISDSALERLFSRAYDEGVVVDREYYDKYKYLRDRIRKQPISLPKEYKGDIADFNEFRRRTFGEVRIVNEGGLGVDEMYAELVTMARELFPEEITHPTDQLKRIAEVAKSIRISERTLNEYYGAEAATFRKWARNDFGAAVGEFTNELRVVSRYEKEANAPDDVVMPAPRTTEEAAEVYAALKEARKNLAKEERNHLLTEEDEQTVGHLLRGEIALRHIEGKTNYAAIKAVYEARSEYERYSKQIREYRENLKKARRAEAEELLAASEYWKDKKAGILYSRETMERNIRDIVPDAALAEKVIAKYFTPIHEAEAEATRMKNRMRDKVRGLNLSRKVNKGDVVSESHAVQLYGEASDNIQMLKDNPKMEKRDGKTLEEWNQVLVELWAQNPGIDRAKIESAAEVFHSIYDELFGLMNDARVRNGYEPVNYRRGYFPHFEEGGSDGLLVSFAKSLGIDSNVTALPTTINGLTHTFKPGITWFGHALERVGWNTVYDAVEGFDRYIEGAAAVIYQTDNIQNLRALATQIRYRAADEQIKKDADKILNDTALDDEAQDDAISKLYKDRRYALSAFVVELEEYTNLLAGKKSSHDRNMESDFGRRTYNFVKKAVSRVGGNMVVANLSSAATNFIPLTQGWSMVSSRDMLRGMWDTLKALKSPDGFASRSSFLTNRRGSDPIVRTRMQDWSAKGSMPMTWIDEFTSDSLVRARYAQNKRKGLSDEAAMSEADAWAAGVMADRSKGSTPTLFQRQNPLAKLFTQFQLEVNNQLSFVTKDMKREAKVQGYGKRQIVAMILKFIAGAWLYDELYEYIFGRRPALDPIGILNDTMGDITGYELPNVVSMGVGLAQGKAPDFTTEKESVAGVIGNLSENIGGELPFVGGVLFEGGRLPISSAIPDVGNLLNAATNSEWSASKRWSTAGKELFKPLSYLLLPFGGGQLKKVVEGMKAVAQGGSYSTDSDGRKKLQYPVFSDGVWGTMGAYTKALLFGKSSFSGAQEWVDSGFRTMNADATATYLGLRSAGMRDREAYETVKGLLEVDGKAERRLMLSEGRMTAEMKFIVYRGMLAASDKEAELLDELIGMGADGGAVADTMLALHAPADLIKLEGAQIEKDPDAPSELRQFAAALRGEQVDFAEEKEVEESESAAKLKRDALLASKLSPRERAVVYYATGASESDKELMEALVQLDADMGTAAELIMKMKDEKNAGKYDLIRASKLKENEKETVCLQIMSDSAYDKLVEAEGAGISVDIYLEYLSATAGLESDRDEEGNAVSGSKREKVMAAINSLRLTRAQKDVLYRLAGYSEKTIDSAPWNKGGLTLPRVK